MSGFETIYDWVTVAIFAGLVVLFLQRSMAPTPKDRMVHYIPPAVGCAAANYVGNEGQPIWAVAIILVVVAYIFLVLKPFDRTS